MEIPRFPDVVIDVDTDISETSQVMMTIDV